MRLRLGLAAEVAHPGLSTLFQPLEIAAITRRDHGRGDPDEVEAEPAGLGLEAVGQLERRRSRLGPEPEAESRAFRLEAGVRPNRSARGRGSMTS